MLTLRMEQHLEQRLEQRMELLQVCVAARRANATRRRVMLLRELRGLAMAPTATCPYCVYVLSLMEIFYGFSRDDPDNTDTECPRCYRRFGADVSVQGVVGYRTVTEREPELSKMIRQYQFLCPPQTLARLRDFARWEPDKIRTDHPGVFYSAYAHFGSLVTAFQRIPLPYPFEERAWTPWGVTRNEPVIGARTQETGLKCMAEYRAYLGHVTAFYGRAPDTDIASVSRLPLSWIRADRHDRGIPTFAELQRRQNSVSRIMEYIRRLERRR